MFKLYKNGSIHENYFWNQNLREIYLYIPVEKSVNSKQVTINLTSSNIIVLINDIIKIEGIFPEMIKLNDSTQSIEEENKEKVIVVYIAKKNCREYWNCMFKGETTIDTTKLEAEKGKLEDLDNDSRKTIEKLMFDSRQKQLQDKFLNKQIH